MDSGAIILLAANAPSELRERLDDAKVHNGCDVMTAADSDEAVRLLSTEASVRGNMIFLCGENAQRFLDTVSEHFGVAMRPIEDKGFGMTDGCAFTSVPDECDLFLDNVCAPVGCSFMHGGCRVSVLADASLLFDSLLPQIGVQSPKDGGSPKPCGKTEKKQSVSMPYHRARRAARRRGIPAAILVACLTIIVAAAFYAFFGDGIISDYSFGYARNIFYDEELSETVTEQQRFTALKNVNADTAAWLHIPETPVDLPVMQADSEKSDYYENHTLLNVANKYGTPYYVNDGGDTVYGSTNTVIRGTNQDGRRVFACLNNYLDIDYYKSAPLIDFDTAAKGEQYKIFAVYLVDTEEVCKDGFVYDTAGFTNNEDFEKYVAALRARSLISTAVDMYYGDRLITMTVPVDYIENGYLAVAARNIRIDEDIPTTGVFQALINENPVMPDSFVEAFGSGDISGRLAELFKDKGIECYTAEEYSEMTAEEDNSEPATAETTTVEVTTTAAPATTEAATEPEAEQQEEVMIPSVGIVEPQGEAQPDFGDDVSLSGISPDNRDLGTLCVTNQNTGEVVEGAAADIIAQVVEAEMGSSFHPEALKAQAVAAYSWILKQYSYGDTAPVVPMRSPGSAAVAATNAVIGQTVTYNGVLAETSYYACSAGYTNNSQDVWGSALPYLVSVDSSVDKNTDTYWGSCTYSADEARRIIESSGISLSGVDKSQWITVTARDGNGLYATSVSFGGKASVTGYKTRSTYFTRLRSTCFEVSYDPAADSFVFSTRGYGHGVGMSQVGANEYAKQGASYVWILKHYYTGVSVG